MSVPSWVANWALVAIGGWPKGMQLNLTRFVTRLIVLTALTSRGKPTSLEYKTNQLIGNVIISFPCTGSCVVDAPSLLKRFHLRTKMIFKHDLRRTKKKLNPGWEVGFIWICNSEYVMRMQTLILSFETSSFIIKLTEFWFRGLIHHHQVFNPQCLIREFKGAPLLMDP